MWHRHTQVGDFRVSSIGDYRPYFGSGKRQTVGAGAEDFFETMVFRLTPHQNDGNEGCGCREIDDWAELECQRYSTAGEAQVGHENIVAKYLGISEENQHG